MANSMAAAAGSVLSVRGGGFPIKLVAKLIQELEKLPQVSELPLDLVQVDGFTRCVPTEDVASEDRVWVVKRVRPCTDTQAEFPVLGPSASTQALDVYSEACKSLSYCLQDSREPDVGWVPLEKLDVTIVWPNSDWKKGKPVTRDWCPVFLCGHSSVFRSVKLLQIEQRYSWIKPFFMDGEEKEKHLHDVKTAIESWEEGNKAVTDQDVSEPLGLARVEMKPRDHLAVYTDQPFVKKALEGSKVFQVIENAAEADVWHISAKISDFAEFDEGLPQFVSQFPFEGGFVQRDLLCTTLRKFCNDVQNASWYLPSFDLSVGPEFAAFAAKTNPETSWCLKPTVGGTGKDVKFAKGIMQVLHTLNATTGNLIAQEECTTALQVEGQKCECRSLVLVKSFTPLKAYLCDRFYVRGNQPVASTIVDQDPSKLPGWSSQGAALVTAMSQELLHAFSRMMYDAARQTENGVGLHWEKFRAIYGLDWMPCTDNNGSLQVKLLKVSYSPDLSVVGEVMGNALVEQCFRILYDDAADLDEAMLASMGFRQLHQL